MKKRMMAFRITSAPYCKKNFADGILGF